VFLGLPHRLDRPTSGILVLAKTSKVLPRLNKLFQTKDEVHKVYWAVVDNRPPKFEDTLTHYLIKNEEKNRSYAYDEKREGAKLASLTYRHVASIDRYHLLEVELHTGRHHQIRVQLKQLGLHIKGDLKYGFPRSNKDMGIHLHARKLETGVYSPCTKRETNHYCRSTRRPGLECLYGNVSRRKVQSGRR